MGVFSRLALVSLMIGLPMAAQADGWYVGAEGGLNISPEETLKDHPSSTSFFQDVYRHKQSHDLGFGLIGDVGYGFGPVRVEGELGWRRNGIDKINVDGQPYKGAGDIDALSIMTNVYYDLHTQTAWTPYIGAGIGYADISANNIKANNILISNDSDSVLAYQGILGVNYALNEKLSLNADYRYFRTSDFTLHESTAWSTSNRTLKGPYEAHSLFFGVTYQFGGPEKVAQATSVAAPAPIPAPAPKAATQAVIAKSYLVFFDFDKSDITPEAQKIISQAATNAKASNATTIQLTGHTDAAGSEKYNMALSLRRANTVKAALTKLGIPDSEISVIGKGKSDPLVPTKDGVREPQNRRVQILLP